MIDYLIRNIKRLLVFLPGLGLVLLVARDVYSIFDDRVPKLLAILLAYAVTAYVLIPAGFRVFRLIVKPKHVPFYSTTPDGFASDPVNIAFFGSRESVIKAMTQIGWFLAEPKTVRNLFRYVTSILFKRPYPSAPFSSLYLLGRSQDLGFQLPVDNNPRHRHHVRFWAVKPATAEQFKEHIAFWQTHQPDNNLSDDVYLWLGAASLDIGLAPVRHNGQITHMIHHDTNAERELIVRSLRKTGAIKKLRSVTIAKPYRLSNRALSGYLQSDGKLTIIEL